MSIANVIFGKPLASDGEGEKVGPLTGVPILGLDALPSAAYGPEALLTALIPSRRGRAVLRDALTLVIVALLIVLYLSYRQTISAYQSSAGAYAVAKENLGRWPSLFAAAALCLDYLLNSAVAISAGAGALASAVPSSSIESPPSCTSMMRAS